MSLTHVPGKVCALFMNRGDDQIHALAGSSGIRVFDPDQLDGRISPDGTAPSLYDAMAALTTLLAETSKGRVTVMVPAHKLVGEFFGLDFAVHS